MAITRNLKPLKHTGNESKEELLIRLNKWSTWYESTLHKIETDYREELAGYKHREDLQQVQVTQEREARLKDGFKCSCHRWIDTIGKLHEELANEEEWKHKVQQVVNNWKDKDLYGYY